MVKQVEITIVAPSAALALAHMKLKDAARAFENYAQDNKIRREKYELAKVEGLVTIGLNEIPSPKDTEDAWLENAKMLRNIATQLLVK